MPRLSLLTYSLSLVLLGYGMLIFIFGPSLTAIAETYDVPLSYLGLVFTLFSVGLIPSVLLAGYLSEIVGKRPLLLLSLLIAGAGSMLFGLVPGLGERPNFLLALAAAVVLGAGGGGIETLVNAVIADDNQPKPGFALNFTHAFFAVGAVLGPIVAGAVLKVRLPWQVSYFGGGALFALLFLMLLPQRFPNTDHQAFTGATARRLLRSPVLWLMLLAMSLYVGAEAGLSTWVSPLMEKVLASPRHRAGLSVSVFWAGMIVGRVAVSALAIRFRPAPMILLLSVGSAVASAAVAVSPSIFACLAASAAAGLFMAGLFGLVLTDAARHFPQHSGAVFGLLTAGVGTGALVFPALMGFVASAANLRAAMLIPAAAMLAVAFAYLSLRSR